jgi:ribosomal protein S27E
MITVICTKCGTANQVKFSGYRDKVRCMSCNKLMSVGGKERGLKALPLEEISVVLGIVFTIAAIVTVIMIKDQGEDPLKKHRAVINQVAMGIVKQAAKTEWEDVKLLYVKALFNNEVTFACTQVGYQYTERGLSWTIVVPMKFRRKEPETKEEKDKIIWEAKAIGVVDPMRVRKLERQRQKASRVEIPATPALKPPPVPVPGAGPKAGPPPASGAMTPGPAPKGGPPPLPGNTTAGPAPRGGPPVAPAAEKPKPEQPKVPEAVPQEPEPGDEEEEELVDDNYSDECDGISEDWLSYRWFPFNAEKHKPILHGKGGEEFLKEARK